jgi:hypothetical protein
MELMHLAFTQTENINGIAEMPTAGNPAALVELPFRIMFFVSEKMTGYEFPAISSGITSTH